MRLIDADALIEEIEKNALEVEQQTQGRRNGKTLAYGILIGLDSAKKSVSEQPTAYDRDKVTKELDKASDYYESNEQGMEHVQMLRLVDAIEIVKGGGVNV